MTVAPGFSGVVEAVGEAMRAAGSMVRSVEVHEGMRGWLVTGYVQPDALKLYRNQLFSLAKRALLHAAELSDKVFVLGFAADPFSPMPLGFGAALAEVEDREKVCWGSYSKGFCENPSTCCLEHPKRRVGVHITLKPARQRAQ